jgi:hypothetical protein
MIFIDFLVIRLHTTIKFTGSLIDPWNTSQTSKLIKVAMTDTSTQVKIQEALTGIVVATEGLHQGDRLVALLYFSTLKYVVRQINLDKNNKISYILSQIMTYTDNVHNYYTQEARGLRYRNFR